MQYSTNPDEALRFLIRSQPTLAGQYRQAVLQSRDRLQALEGFHRSVAKMKQVIIIDQLRYEQYQNKKPLEAEEIGIWQAELELKKLEIEEKQQQLNEDFDLVQDAQRELETCQAEIARINEEAGYDFAELSSADYQKQMADDFRHRKSRAIAAGLIFGSPSAIEMLLELPASDRLDYLKRSTVLIDEIGSIRSDLAILQDCPARLQNGAT